MSNYDFIISGIKIALRGLIVWGTSNKTLVIINKGIKEIIYEMNRC